jgi:hypothetical protein
MYVMMIAGLEHHDEGVQLHQPHSPSGSAGEVERVDHTGAAAEAHAHHL